MNMNIGERHLLHLTPSQTGTFTALPSLPRNKTPSNAILFIHRISSVFFIHYTLPPSLHLPSNIQPRNRIEQQIRLSSQDLRLAH
jgi:hypothetical protein